MGSRERTTPYLVTWSTGEVTHSNKKEGCINIDGRGLNREDAKWLGQWLIEWAEKSEFRETGKGGD